MQECYGKRVVARMQSMNYNYRGISSRLSYCSLCTMAFGTRGDMGCPPPPPPPSLTRPTHNMPVPQV